MELVKNMVTLSPAPGFFFWSPDPLAAPQASIPKGPKTIVSPLDLGEINHYNNWKHHQKKHIEKWCLTILVRCFQDFSLFFWGGFGIWWIIRWDVPKLEKWSDLLCSAGACIKNVWDSFEIYMLCMRIYIYLYLSICYVYFFYNYHQVPYIFSVCVCISMCALGPSLAI